MELTLNLTLALTIALDHTPGLTLLVVLAYLRAWKPRLQRPEQKGR